MVLSNACERLVWLLRGRDLQVENYQLEAAIQNMSAVYWTVTLALILQEEVQPPRG